MNKCLTYSWEVKGAKTRTILNMSLILCPRNFIHFAEVLFGFRNELSCSKISIMLVLLVQQDFKSFITSHLNYLVLFEQHFHICQVLQRPGLLFRKRLFDLRQPSIEFTQSLSGRHQIHLSLVQILFTFVNIVFQVGPFMLDVSHSVLKVGGLVNFAL